MHPYQHWGRNYHHDVDSGQTWRQAHIPRDKRGELDRKLDRKSTRKVARKSARKLDDKSTRKVDRKSTRKLDRKSVASHLSTGYHRI